MSVLSFKALSVNDNFKYYQLLQQVSANENGFHNEMFGKSHSGYFKWLQLSVDEKVGKNLRPGYVPRSTYWLLNDDGIPVGIGRIKHQLTPAMKKNSGHIAYAIGRPFRGQGYGSKLCQLLIDECRKMGINPIQVTVEFANEASNRIVRQAGGRVVGQTDTMTIYQI
ncbi:GNAT family N-acetyltransferase [Furfurilactobacillus rossiae]|uniref:N-acetyltransferase domain-containing protein n=1 Tax=Furfurilactobacillus rossiae DSM 15814 TaxID=1114972 RepID=A0A0R1R9G2_9LACO|nr:hypothetical protein FD35_GL001291 [Furfurilactobacillus rossiae DSM 15814]QFR67168.1 GNAT family N-acetyltransferase [Furfurilactobacillus rossiae]